jgi:DMSO reductase anchor subunit
MQERTTLVAFTLLAQAGIGLALAAQLLGGAPAAAPVALLLAAIGLAAAFGHLGRPLRAHRALANLGRSWLSRECLALGLFVTLGLGRLAWAPRPGTGPLGWLEAAAGVLALASMAAIYAGTPMPAWRTRHVCTSFSTAALALGTWGLAALAGGPARGPALALAAGAVAVQLVETAVHLAGLGAGGPAARASLARLRRPSLAAGLALTAAGGLACALLAGAGPAPAPGLAAAGAALGLGQALVRHAFFAAGIHPMAAGWADLPASEPGRGPR